MPLRYRLFLIFAALTIAADQLSKLAVRSNLALGQIKTFIPGFWDWELSFNPGSAFGLFRSTDGARIFLTVVGVLACLAILIIVRRGHDGQRWMSSALGLVFGGALGNVIDRLTFGKVTDFVVWHISTFKWPTFNVADAALVLGVIVLFLDVGREQKKKK